MSASQHKFPASFDNKAPAQEQDAALSGLEFPWPPSNGNYATYDLHCHCGAIRYTIKLSPPLYEEHTTSDHPERYVAMECDCSYCERNGYWSVHPLAKDVQFTRGLEHRGEYRTANKQCPQLFCKLCGSVLATDLTWLMKEVAKTENRTAINVRMLKDFDRKKLLVKRSEMMSQFPPKYSIGD